MASFCRFLLIVCIAVIYCTEYGHCLPAREARMPTPTLEKICRGSASTPLFKSHTLLCFLCKGFDISCFSSSTTTSSTTTSTSAPTSTTSAPTSYTNAPTSTSSVASTSRTSTTPATSTSEAE